MKDTYFWNGEEKRFDDRIPHIVQAYLAWLEDDEIRARIYMQDQGEIHGFADKTSKTKHERNFHFDMQNKYVLRGETFYNIQLQGKRAAGSRSVSKGKTGDSTDSYCNVHISADATPSPAVFRAACWSSAERCHEQSQKGHRKTKTMHVYIHKDNTWVNDETGETGYDQAAAEEARRAHEAAIAKNLRALQDRQESGELVQQWEWERARGH